MISFLFVDSERVWRGGQDQLLSLLRGFVRLGHQVSLVCHPRTLLEDRARAIGAKVYPLSFSKFAAGQVFFRLWAVMRRVRPDILAFNTPKPILPGTLASKLTSIPVRIIFRRVNFPLRQNLITRWKYNWNIDCIVAISESIHWQLQKGGIPACRIRTIYEGLDLSLYPPRLEPIRRLPGEPKIIGTIAHLSAEKGLSHLIEAAAHIHNAPSRLRFIIVGDGDCRQELERQVRARNLTACFDFVGFQNAPIEYLQQFDIFVLPSLSEGLSSAILSAMAMALPVIATNVGGIPELVMHEENGLLVPPADPIALAEAIDRLTSDAPMAFRMGEKSRKRMEANFTLERKILETEQLCRVLLQSGTAFPPPTHA